MIKKRLNSTKDPRDHLLNIKTYDKSAKKLAGYFRTKKARVADIELGLELANATSSARVVEIGCGDGRDAVEIVKRVDWYEGFDPSKKLLEIARNILPQASFELAIAESYDFPENLDVIYAFASLLHVDRDDLKIVLQKTLQSLREGGVILVSLKESTDYARELKKDKFGQRIFYLYNPQLIKELAGNKFTSIYEDHQIKAGTAWFTLVLKKL